MIAAASAVSTLKLASKPSEPLRTRRSAEDPIQHADIPAQNATRIVRLAGIGAASRSVISNAQRKAAIVVEALDPYRSGWRCHDTQRSRPMSVSRMAECQS
jgi:hypothetical protein